MKLLMHLFWKTAKFGPNYAFLVILGQILAFLIHLVPCPANKSMRKWFSDMWVPELLLPPKIIRISGLKRAFLPQNVLSWPHIGLAGIFGALSVG